MNFRWIAAALIAAITLATGGLSYLCLRAPTPDSGRDDALLWLRHEFALTADTMTRIEAMHAAYQVVCDEHCRQVRDARAEIKALHAASAGASDLATAHARAAALDLLCTTSLEGHMREVAAVIGGSEGERYLAIVLPRIASFDHTGAPSLDLDPADPHAGHAHH